MLKISSQSPLAKLIAGVVIGLLVGVAAVALHYSGISKGYSLKTLDLLFRKAAPVQPTNPNIVIVTVDQGSLDFYQGQGVTWPWPRQMYAPIIEYCRAAGARAVIFDVLFTESSSYGSEDDLLLAQTLGQARDVFLPLFFSCNPREDRPHEMTSLEKFALDIKGTPLVADQEYCSIIPPIPPLLAGVKGLGNVEGRPEDGGIFRRIPLVVPYQGHWWPQLAMAAFLNNAGPFSLSWQKQGLALTNAESKTQVIPLLPDGNLLLKFRRSSLPYRRFAAANVIQSYLHLQAGEQPIYPLADFANKWVLVGLTAPGLMDLRPTPLSSISPGVEIQATILENLLGRDFLTALNRTGFIFLTLGISVIAALVVLFAPSLIITLLSLPVLLGLFGVLTIVLFRNGIWLESFHPSWAIIFSFVVSSAYSYFTEGRQKREIRRVFSHYMSDFLIQNILKNPEKLQLGGERREMTIFFSDVAGFTSISEMLTPEELVALLNEYLSQMTDIILGQGGIIDKYEGDAIMAFWGAPVYQPDHAARACLAALEQQQQMEVLRRHWQERGLPLLTARMGINTGHVIIGNMGSNTRFDYTVMGDAVNLASRLEGANKSYGSLIMVSETTAGQVKDVVELRELDLIAVKGKTQPVRVFEVLALRGELSSDVKEAMELFARGLVQYRWQNWDQAIELFEQVLRLQPVDGPAQVFLSRCQNLTGQDLGPDWDGVFRMTTK
jgi:adenylate cyclase